jgi:hypothetical protein
MNAPTIINFNNFDVKRVTLHKNPPKPKRPAMFSLKYDGQNFQLRFPAKMSSRLFTQVDEETGKISYVLSANMKNVDPYAKERSTGTTDMDKLYNTLAFDLKDKILDTAEQNSIEWFKEEMTRPEILKHSYNEMYKLSVTKDDKGMYAPNGKYPPTVRVKVPVWEGKVTCQVVDSSLHDVYVTPETLDKVFLNNMDVNMIVVPSVYASKANCGVTFRLAFAQIFPKQRLTAASVFTIEDNNDAEEENEEEREEERVAEPEVEAPVQKEVTVTTTTAPARKKRTAAH